MKEYVLYIQLIEELSLSHAHTPYIGDHRDNAASNGHVTMDNPTYDTGHPDKEEMEPETKWDNPIYGLPDQDIDPYDMEDNQTEAEVIYSSIDT